MSEAINMKWLLSTWKDVLNSILKVVKDDIMPVAEVYGSWNNFQSKATDLQAIHSIASKLDVATVGKLFMMALELNFVIKSWNEMSRMSYDELKGLADKIADVIAKVDECLAELEKIAPSDVVGEAVRGPLEEREEREREA